jgi:type IV secretory pathway VirB2 component (pilin)
MLKKFLVLFGIFGLLGTSLFAAGEAPQAIGSFVDMVVEVLQGKIITAMLIVVILISGWMYLQTFKKFYLLAGVLCGLYLALAVDFTEHLKDWAGVFIG